MVPELRSVAEDALVDLRRVTRDLRPTILDDLGLVSAIEWLASDLRDRSGLDVRLSSRGTGSGLSSEQEVGVFRIVQEALSNVEKHAQASRVDLAVDCDGDGLRVVVRDDGVGFDRSADVGALARRGRYGLLGMQERAALNGGRLSVDSALGRGATVTLEIRSGTGERTDGAHGRG